MRYYFKKPSALVNKQPVKVNKENGETIGIIMKSPAKISFFRDASLFSTEPREKQELAALTFEIAWREGDDAAVVFHDLENDKQLAFYEDETSRNFLHLFTTESEFPIEIIQKNTIDRITILFHGQESAFIILQDQQVLLQLIDENTNVPDSFFFLSYFIVILSKIGL